MRYPLTETIALQRWGHSAATILAVRAPQSQPAMTAHEGLDAVMSRHRSGVDRRFEIGRRDRYSEIDPPATFDRTVHRGKIDKISLHDFGPEHPQGVSPFILSPYQGAHVMPLGEQHCSEMAAYRTDVAGCSGHEDGTAMGGDFVAISLPCTCVQIYWNGRREPLPAMAAPPTEQLRRDSAPL